MALNLYFAGSIAGDSVLPPREAHFLSSRGGQRVLLMEATGYSRSRREGTWDGITATGHVVRRGVAAVDPEIVPLGTKLYVEDYGPAVALDTGGGIKGCRIDLFFPTVREALEWGRRKVRVVVLDD